MGAGGKENGGGGGRRCGVSMESKWQGVEKLVAGRGARRGVGREGGSPTPKTAIKSKRRGKGRDGRIDLVVGKENLGQRLGGVKTLVGEKKETPLLERGDPAPIRT